MQMIINLLLTVGWAVGVAGIMALLQASRTLSQQRKQTSGLQEKNG